MTMIDMLILDWFICGWHAPAEAPPGSHRRSAEQRSLQRARCALGAAPAPPYLRAAASPLREYEDCACSPDSRHRLPGHSLCACSAVMPGFKRPTMREFHDDALPAVNSSGSSRLIIQAIVKDI